MKVIVAGGYGCGTTHVYRIARGVLEASGIGAVCRGISRVDLEAEGVLEDPRPHVLKTHDAIVPPAPGRFVLLCVRDPLDAAASHLRRAEGGLQAVLWGVRMRRELEQGYAAVGVEASISYEQYHARPIEKVRAIAKALELELEPGQVAKIAKETGVAATKAYCADLREADWATELRPNHIGPTNGAPGGGKLLPAALQVKIGAIYAAS